ncbi:MAG: DUF885 family protein [Pseudomonadales bacterium]|nr:DUF885 family protein [Pseudomonadales bacterium]
MRAYQRPSIWLISLFLLSACSEPPAETSAPEPSESERLNTWFDAKFEEALDFFPIRKTFLGIKDEDYGRVDDLSEAGSDAYLAWQRAATDELQAEFSYTSLDSVTKDSYDFWIYQTDMAEKAEVFRKQEYVFTQMGSMHSFLPQLLISFHRVDDLSDFEALLNRIEESGRALNQLTTRSRRYADAGVHPPYFSYTAVIEESRKLIAGYPFEDTEAKNPLWLDLEQKIEALAESGEIDTTQSMELLKRGREQLLAHWLPAYTNLIEWQETDQTNAAKVATGVGALDNGAAYYRERLAYHTTTNSSAEEIHAIGMREIERIHAAMDAIKEEIGFEGNLTDLFRWMREDTEDRRLFFPNDDVGRQAYIDEATLAIENIKGRLPEYFGILPKADLVVRRVEAFREQDGAAQHYFASTPDGSRPGIYYAHLSDMHAMPRPELEVIAYHEGLPGHHMQIAIAKELQGIPEFRKNAGVTTFSEGWGLYAERFAKEIPGTYQTPLSEFGRLNSELWRAVRLVVDTGLHAMDWSEERAFDFMMANASLAVPAARSEIRRYIVMPGQATAYMMGMLKIVELRERAEAKLGDKFDIRVFHDVILDSGALPVGLLERKVDRWLAQ